MKSKLLPFLLYFIVLSQIGFSQSVSLPTDRARITVASIPDYYGGPNLKVLHTDAGTPMRAGTAWIWEKSRQEEPLSYYVSMRSKGLNAVRMILFDTWEIDAYVPSAVWSPTNWNDAAYRTRQLARMERSVNYASANGMYIIINSHNQIPKYDEAYANALWTYVAPYFANRTHVIYEAANEPMSGVGNDGDMDMGEAGALSSPRLQALKRTYNIIRNAAPNTHIMILTPPGVNDYATARGVGNLAGSFGQLPGVVDWTKTSVAYHLYSNDRGFGDAAVKAKNLRNLHSRYPAWPSENNFPYGVSNATLGITDSFRSANFDDDFYPNQTCEKLGFGWSMWNINGQVELDRNWPVMYADAVAKGWTWIPDNLTPDAQAPTQPNNLVATNITPNSATLTWTAATDNIGVTGYEVFLDGLSIGTTAAANFKAVGLLCAKTGGFTVKARDGKGNFSIASNPLAVTTTGCITTFVVEAETNYTIVAEVGTKCAIAPSNYAASTASNSMVVGLCDVGDEIKIAINVPETGIYNVQVRVRSGWGFENLYFITNNKYEYKINNVIKTFTYVSGSATTTIDVDSYYGTVELKGIYLNAGINYVGVKTLESWAKVDYVSIEYVASDPLPLNFISFTAKQSLLSNDLNWVVANEINNKQFDVSRSDDGLNFKKIGEVRSEVTGRASQTSYNFKDFEMPSKAFYRLKQIDTDGKYDFSKIIYLKANPTAAMVNQVYPNPVGNQLNLIIYADSKESITINICDKVGRILFAKTAFVEKGKNTLSVNMENYSVGFYILTAKDKAGKTILNSKLVKE